MHEAKRHLTAWLAIIVGAAVLAGAIAVGCGGSSSSGGTGSTSGSTAANGSTATGSSTTTSGGNVVLKLSNPSSLGGSTVVMTGTDETGQTLFGPTSFPLSAVVSAVGVPTQVSVFSIYILRADGHVVESYTDEIDLSIGFVVITDPPFVSDSPVVYTFAVMGGIRLDKGDVAQFGNQDSVDQNQYLRSLADQYGTSASPSPTCTPPPPTSAGLPPSPLPARVFFTGDEVLGLKGPPSDPTNSTLASELNDWTGYTAGAGLPSPSTSPGAPDLNPNWHSRVVVMPGNHEMLENAKSGSGKKKEVPNETAGATFVQGMNAYIAASNGPKQGGSIGRDESMLSYYFTDTFTNPANINATGGSETVGFVCLDTDTYETDGQIGHVPVDWLQNTALPALSDCAHIFILGHKPITAPDPKNQGPESAINSADQEAFYQALTGSGLVRGYLTGHLHLWQKPTTYSNWAPSTNPVPQILFGSSGAPPDKSYMDACASTTHWKNPFSGFMLVRIHADNSMSVQAWGRPVAPDGSPTSSAQYYAKPCCERATVLRHHSRFYPWSVPPLCPPSQ